MGVLERVERRQSAFKYLEHEKLKASWEVSSANIVVPIDRDTNYFRYFPSEVDSSDVEMTRRNAVHETSTTPDEIDRITIREGEKVFPAFRVQFQRDSRNRPRNKNNKFSVETGLAF